MTAPIAVLNKRGGKATLSSYDEANCKRFGEAKVFFNGKIYLPTSIVSAPEVVAKWFQRADSFKASEAFLKEAEGDFAFMIAEPERIIAGRDPLGVQPLYYGETRTIVALAMNRRTLWKLGIEEARSFPPGHLVIANREGFNFKSVNTLVYSKPKQVTMQEAAETLQRLLEQSVRRRVSIAEKVAVAFSGGLDSSVMAFLAKKFEADVQLIHVSLENQLGIEEAKEVADALDLPLKVYLYKDEDIERVVSKVVILIEDADPVKASIGVPFYWTAKRTVESGFKVLLAGQCADELFGGYQRYVKEYMLHGREKVMRTMFDDLIRINESNLERDMKICRFHNIELRLPYCSYQIAKFALSLPIELKIERHSDTLRKLVLRKVAEKMGLPASVTEKPKKALQYSTGVNNALKKIAKKQKTTVAEYLKQLFLSEKTRNSSSTSNNYF